MTEPLPPQPPAYDEPAAGRFQDKRALAIIGAAVAAVIAVGALVVVPKLGGSSSSTTSASAVPHGHPKVAPSATPAATPAAAAAVATAAPALHVRDPFGPLVAVPVAAPAAPSAAPSASATSQAPTVVVVEPTATPAAAKYTVQLTSLSIDPNNDKNDSAVVVVNGTSQTVKGDQPFPTANGPFALVGVATDGANHQYDSGQFLYGDQVFSLSIKETQTFS